MKKTLKVTVLMSVYNGQKYLIEAIDSILNQTFTKFEFIIINDGSNDKTLEILSQYSDPRLKIFNHDENLGLTKSLNIGLNLARGEYIARMDADDISLPDRLKTQVEFLDKNPDVAVCGSWVEIIGIHSGTIWKYPEKSNEIKCKLLFENTLAHSSVCIRKNYLEKNELRYNESLYSAQDYELWVKIASFSQIVNLPEILIQYRIHPDSIGLKKINQQNQSAISTQIYQLNKYFNIYPDEREKKIHVSLCFKKFESNYEYVISVNNWLRKLVSANKNYRIFPDNEFSNLIGRIWFSVCLYGIKNGIWIWFDYWRSPLSKLYHLDRIEKITLFSGCIFRCRIQREISNYLKSLNWIKRLSDKYL